MARLSIVVVCLVSAFALTKCSSDAFYSNVEIEYVQNLSEFLSANTGIKLQPLHKVKTFNGPSSRTRIVHSLGRRISGDRLLATDSASQQWNKPQDVRLNLNYPQSGLGMVITYIEVVVEQSSTLSQAYVTSGGIGQHQISIVVESKHTLYFKHNATIYGY